LSGNTKDMTEDNRNSSKGPRAVHTGTTARKKVQNAASDAKQNGAAPARQAKSAAIAAEKAAESGTTSLGMATAHAGKSAAAGLESGRRVVTSLGTSVASGATVAWSMAKNRKKIVAGAGAGFVGLMGAAFAAGRRTAGPQAKGPLSRLTGGRI
jgi:hypothetical protein